MAFKSNTKNKLAIFEELPANNTNLKRKNYDNDVDQSVDTSSYDGDLVIDYDDEQQDILVRGPSKKKKKKMSFDEELLNLKCMWEDCTEYFENYEKYFKHVYCHLSYGDVKCLWKDCEFEGSSTDVLSKHLCYHCYFAKLQNIGQSVVDRLKLPNCNQNIVNQMPAVYNDFKCEWDECGMFCTTYQEFLCHVALHFHRSSYKNEMVKCPWQSCNVSCNGIKLVLHVRSHTKEKRVACPTCCATFVSNTKLGDHRKRQMAIHLLRFQCCTCSKLFGSERLLREHMKAHINHYKCSMCEMTCLTPSTLLRHIRYRHINDRPFKCHLCKKASVTSYDLQQHLITHSEEGLFECDECDFKCKSTGALDTHYSVAHGQDTRNIYECHCCQSRFRKGMHLTKHLMGKHDYLWPAGHTRFRYKPDANGIRHLQTVRYESLEVTQEMMSKKLPEFPANLKMNLEYEGFDDKYHKYKITFKENTDDDVDDDGIAQTEEQENENTFKSEQSEKDESLNPIEVLKADDNMIVLQTSTEIEIVVEDVDEEGNVLRSEIIKSNEVMYVDENKT